MVTIVKIAWIIKNPESEACTHAAPRGGLKGKHQGLLVKKLLRDFGEFVFSFVATVKPDAGNCGAFGYFYAI